MGKLDKENIEKLVDKIIHFFDSQYRKQDIGDRIVYEHLKKFYKIECDEDLYYREVGMHQLLLECVDNYISQSPIMTYKERCLLYEKMSKEIEVNEVYMFLKLLEKSEKVFIINL